MHSTRARVVGLVILLVGLSMDAAAQTTVRLAWDYDAPEADVATYTQVVTIDNVRIPGTPTCVAGTPATPPKTTCTISVPTLAAGRHTVSVSAERGGNIAETRVTGVDLALAPQAPSAPRIHVTVTVNIQ